MRGEAEGEPFHLARAILEVKIVIALRHLWMTGVLAAYTAGRMCVLVTHSAPILSQAEQIQLVHYSIGQKYDAHHDWAVQEPSTRFATLLLYLNTPQVL